MPDLTAPQLIALLREHPGVCRMLKVHGYISEPFGLTFKHSQMKYQIFLHGEHRPHRTANFRRWLVGAAVEKCDELDIEIVRYADGFGTIERQHVVATTGDIGHRMVIGKKHPTRLHAALAALEQHAKEKSNG